MITILTGTLQGMAKPPVASVRHVLRDLQDQYDRIEGTSPHANYARAKLAEAIRRCSRDLIGLYGVTLPETDPKIISMKRMLEMVAAPFPTPGGYPAVGEQAVLDRHVASFEDDVRDYYSGGWGDDVGEGY